MHMDSVKPTYLILSQYSDLSDLSQYSTRNRTKNFVIVNFYQYSCFFQQTQPSFVPLKSQNIMKNRPWIFLINYRTQYLGYNELLGQKKKKFVCRQWIFCTKNSVYRQNYFVIIILRAWNWIRVYWSFLFFLHILFYF